MCQLKNPICGDLLDISAIGGLKQSKHLSISYDGTTDLSPMYDLEILQYLEIRGRLLVVDCAQLVRLTHLTELYMYCTKHINTDALPQLFPQLYRLEASPKIHGEFNPDQLTRVGYVKRRLKRHNSHFLQWSPGLSLIPLEWQRRGVRTRVGWHGH